MFSQTQINAAKQTGIDLVKTKPNDYNLFSATDVSTKEVTAKQTGIQEGITKCKTDPVSCGIVVSNDQCKTNPASCNLFTQTQMDSAKQIALQDGINKCKLDPASCGIIVSNDQCKTNPSSCNLFTQAQLDAAKQSAVEQCKNDPNCKGTTAIHATYNPLTGEVHIPFIDVPNGIGFVQTFDVYLIQRNGSFTFDLDVNRIAIAH